MNATINHPQRPHFRLLLMWGRSLEKGLSAAHVKVLVYVTTLSTAWIKVVLLRCEERWGLNDKALLSIQATPVLCQPQIPWLLPASDDGAWSVNPSKDNRVAVRVRVAV